MENYLRRVCILLLGMLMTIVSLAANSEDLHRVVFEVNTPEPKGWEATLNNVENIKKTFGEGNTEIEIVAHGSGIGLFLIKGNAMADRLNKLTHSGVVLAACENTMRSKHIKKENLLSFVTTVDSGVAQVVRKQEAGWSYIKGG